MRVTFYSSLHVAKRFTLLVLLAPNNFAVDTAQKNAYIATVFLNITVIW
jgi:hypothetical protein